jgi:alpha-ketoglutarate-dependent taurine dioxygenase
MEVKVTKFPRFSFPVVVQPAAGLAPALSDALGWMTENRGWLQERMLDEGAVLLRGFPLSQPADMAVVVSVFDVHCIDYRGGSTPRTKILEGIYTSTEISALYKIKLHNELSFQIHYPEKIFFFCQIPPKKWGETILADVRAVCRSIDRSILRKFEDKKVTYLRIFQKRRNWKERMKKVFPPLFHLTWEQVFATEDRSEVEKLCGSLGMDYRWRPSGDLEVTNTLPAIIHHPTTGEPLWFNHVPSLHFNRRTLGNIVYATRKLVYRSGYDVPTNVFYGDGSPIPMSDLAGIYDALDRHTVSFPWEKGDLLIVDNRIIAHGRNPFLGKRKILVAMTKPNDVSVEQKRNQNHAAAVH